MRILYLVNGFPYPLTTGHLRHYYLIRELSRRHAVTLLSVVGRGFAAEHKAAMEPYTEHVETFTSAARGGSLARKAARRLEALARSDQPVRRMCAAVARLVEQKEFDVVIGNKYTCRAAEPTGNVPLIADMCDATSSRILRSMRYAHPARLPLLLLQYTQIRRRERRLMQSADWRLFISPRDRRQLLPGSDGHATIVANGIQSDYWRRTSPELGRHVVVFTGAMNYPPNTDAARYLIQRIFPRVRKAVPDAQLLIVGRDPTPALVKARSQPGVTVTGFVEDVRPYLERATVFAAPLRFGAGIQNKVLEAMAMELPVIASPLAADGLRTEEGREPPLETAQGALSFARQIIQNLQRRARCPQPKSEARRFVERNFLWNRSGVTLEKVLQRVVRLARGKSHGGTIHAVHRSEQLASSAQSTPWEAPCSP